MRSARLLRHGLAALLGLPLLAGTAQAQVECSGGGPHAVPANWALKPSAIGPGGTFRLLFVSSTTRDATSTAIADYNTHVRNAAKNTGHSAITDSCGNLFTAVASTSAVDARDNTSTTGVGEPIYWLNGPKVADDYADFYDNSWDDESLRGENGGTISLRRPWTGSANNGTSHPVVPLGGSTADARSGGPGSLSGTPLSGLNEPKANQNSLYALSPVFKVKPPPPPEVSVEWFHTGQVVEGDAVRFRFELDPAPTTDLKVNYTLYEELDDGTTRTGGWIPESRSGSQSLAVLSHSGTASLDLQSRSDGTNASGDIVVLLLGSGKRPGDPGYYRPGVNQSDGGEARVAVSDGSDAPPDPVVYMQYESAAITDAPELVEGDAIRVRLYTPEPLVEAVTVNVAFEEVCRGFEPCGASPHGGTRRAGDYTEFDAIPGGVPVAIPKGARYSDVFSSETVDDDVSEWQGTVRVRVAPGTGYVRGGTYRAFHVSDDDPAEVSVSAPKATVREGTRAAWVHVHANPEEDRPLEVNYRVSGTATPGADYTIEGLDNGTRRGTMTVPLGRPHWPLWISVVDDDIEDSGETVVVTLEPGDGYTLSWRSSATVTILNHDPTLEELIQERIDRTAANGDAHSNRLWRRALAAVRGEDPPDGLQPMTQAEAQRLADNHRRAGRTELAGLWQRIADALAETPPPDPTITISGGGAVTEGGAATFTLSADAAPESALTVELTVSETGDFVASGGEGAQQVTIPAGRTTATHAVATVDDGEDEADGSVTAALNAGEGYDVGSPASATVAVSDNDDAAAWEPKREIVDAVNRIIHNHRPKSQGGTGNKGAWGRGQRILGGIMGEDRTAAYPGHAAETFAAYTSKECRDTARKYGVTNIWRPWCDEIARREAWESSAGADRAPAAVPAVDAEAGALALLEGVTPETAAAALYDRRVLDEARLEALDRLGNANGGYDLGDLLAWIARCRGGEARCGGTGGPADGAGLLPLGAGLAVRRRRKRERTRTPERTGRRAGRRPRPLALALALAAAVWGCDAGGPGGGGPTEPAALAGPGAVELRIEVPAGARAAGAMLVVEGPGIDSVEPSAPGLELIHLGGTPARTEVIVAGELATGALLRIGVPDIANGARYRAAVVQVAGGDHELVDPAGFEVLIAR